MNIFKALFGKKEIKEAEVVDPDEYFDNDIIDYKFSFKHCFGLGEEIQSCYVSYDLASTDMVDLNYVAHYCHNKNIVKVYLKPLENTHPLYEIKVSARLNTGRWIGAKYRVKWNTIQNCPTINHGTETPSVFPYTYMAIKTVPVV